MVQGGPEDLDHLRVQHVMVMEKLELRQAFLQLKEPVPRAEVLDRLLLIHV